MEEFKGDQAAGFNMDDYYELIGRQKELKEYTDAWDKECRIFGFYGMTKVGKTRLCTEFIKYIRENEDSEINDLWFDFKDIHTLDDFNKDLFERPDLKHDSSNVTTSRQKVINYMKENESTKFVFVFDSLEEAMPKANKDGSSPDQFVKTLWDELYDSVVKPFLSNCKNVYFCITSCTWAKFASYNKISCLQKIAPLSKDQSVALLEEVIGDTEDKSCLETIAALCDGLPGAIVNVGTDMKSEEWSNEEIVEILIDRKLQALSNEFLPASDKIEDGLNGMISKLTKENKSNLKALTAGGSKINMATGTYAFDCKKKSLFKFDVLIPLKYRSLVETNRKSGDISVHPITEEFMKLHHASTTTKDRKIAKRVRKFIEAFCHNQDKGKDQGVVEQLKDYRDRGFPDNFKPSAILGESDHVPVTGIRNIDITNRGHRHSSAGIPRLNDLSPATSTEKDDRVLDLNCDSNLHTSLEQKPSLMKEIMYNGPAEDGDKSILNVTGDQYYLSGDITTPAKKKLIEDMNLGCSIEENDRIIITPEKRMSENVKRNNLSRSLSAQSNTSLKLNSLTRALTVQDNYDPRVQIKRKMLSRADAFEENLDGKSVEDPGQVKWDDCCGSSQNIISEENSIPRNSSCEMNDSVSMEDNVNAIIPVNKLQNNGPIHNKVNNDSTISNNSLHMCDPPIVRPKTSLSYLSSQDQNSLKKLLYSQISSSSSNSSGSETYMKEQHKEAVEHSLEPSLNHSVHPSLSLSFTKEINNSMDGNNLPQEMGSLGDSYKGANSTPDSPLPDFSLLSVSATNSITQSSQLRNSSQNQSEMNKNGNSSIMRKKNGAQRLLESLKRQS